jgi:citrate lyase subunit beta / citryl-CoA lyase
MTFAIPGPAMLFCPGNRPERFDKAVAAADFVILDLEDAVSAELKPAARDHVAAALDRLGADVVVRINAVGTPWHDGDVGCLRRRGAPPAVMLAKTESAAQLASLADFDVLALCETATGIANVVAIAAQPNCVGVMWGAEDLIASVGGRSSRSSSGRYYPAIEHARAAVLFGAGAAGKPAIDSVFLDIADLAGMAVESAEAADLGFRAKACIHPTQAGVVRRAFGPTPQQTDWARGVLAAAAETTDGVFSYEGRMIDAPILAHARAMLLNQAPH